MAKSSTSFKEGNPGGPGRTPGARNKLSEAFLHALNTTFEELTANDEPAGIESLRELRDKQPAQYHNVIAKLMPKLMELSGPDGGSIDMKWTVEVVEPDDMERV